VINDPVVSPGCVARTILGWLTEWLTRFPAADPPRGPAPPLSPTLALHCTIFFFAILSLNFSTTPILYYYLYILYYTLSVLRPYRQNWQHSLIYYYNNNNNIIGVCVCVCVYTITVPTQKIRMCICAQSVIIFGQET
jgi:hypothetical protein